MKSGKCVELLAIESSNGSQLMEKLNQHSIHANTDGLTINPVFNEFTDYHTFNKLENTRISELTTATNIFNYPVTKNLIYLRDKVQIYRMTRIRVEDLIRDIIKFCKSLVSFTNTCPENQLSLVKNGCMSLLCMRFLAYYNVDKTMYYLYLDTENTLLLKLNDMTFDKPEYSTVRERILREISTELNNDSIVMDLLTAIRYLLLKYRSKSESQLKLKRLMELLIEFNTISNMRRAVHSKQMMESLQYCGPLMREPLGCPSDGKCRITPITRKYCAKCRLAKCLEVGMRQKFKQKYNKRKLLVNNNAVNMNEIIESEDYLTNNTKSETLLQKSWNRIIIPVFNEMTDYSTLNELENNRISELTTATNIFNYPLNRVSKARLEYLIRDTIKFSKSLVSFANTCPEDQLSLIKNGCTEMLSMRFLAYYSVDKEMYYVNLDNKTTLRVKLDQLRFDNPEYFTCYKRFLAEISTELNSDPIVMDLICGDRASGRNFGGISCESCKAFFRRTALKNKDPKCHENKNCKIEPKGRKCPKCRLKRCYDYGMRKEFIKCLDRSDKNSIIVEMKPQMTESIDSSNEYSLPMPSESDFFLKVFDNTVTNDDLNAEITEIENYLSNSESSLQDMDTNTANTGYQSSIHAFVSIIHIKEFNELETNRLLELFSAANVFFRSILPIRSEITSLQELDHMDPYLLHNSAVSIIDFAKNLSLYENLYNEDKHALVKYGWSDVRLLRSLSYFNYESQCWTVNMKNDTSATLKLSLIRPLTSGNYTVIEAFINSLMSQSDRDSVILDLLTAIDFDEESSRNFGGLSCNSCKAFFRRTALTDKVQKCHRNQNCKIEPKGKKCRKCRLDRCYASGMRKEFIRCVDESQKNKVIIETKQQMNESIDSYNEMSIPIPNESDFFSEGFHSNICNDDLNAEIIEIENYLSNSENSSQDVDTNTGHTGDVSVNLILKPIIHFKEFNELETNRLLELFSAANVFFTKLSPIRSEITDIQELLYHVNTNLLQQSITSIISFAQNLNSCDNLYKEDKQALVNSAILRLNCLRQLPTSDYYTGVEAFMNSFVCQWDRDSVILDLV
ncbi:unnamed protein product [Oppiella nova]|uniref:Nuclear receptor domain-containing protein n=1 Tax=Oppiella nova TaxID=334625 RepID=A0A7R9LKX7_9ACAR|nr:unnamed protein product [Oppiella nova]CAG2164667.1 unnamed protein product [Oppiella nova]